MKSSISKNTRAFASGKADTPARSYGISMKRHPRGDAFFLSDLADPMLFTESNIHRVYVLENEGMNKTYHTERKQNKRIFRDRYCKICGKSITRDQYCGSCADFIREMQKRDPA